MWKELKKYAGSWIADEKGMIDSDATGQIKKEDSDEKFDILGDFQADVFDDAMEEIENHYISMYGRKPTIKELCKLFMFCVNGEIRMRELDGEVQAIFSGDESEDREKAGIVTEERPVIINLTNEDIHIVGDDGIVKKTIPHWACPPVLESEESNERELYYRSDNIPVVDVKFGDKISDLYSVPEKKDNVYYIVDDLLALAYPDRDDFLIALKFTHCGDGRLSGVRALGKINEV